MSDNPIKVSSARQHCLSACFSSSLAEQAPAALPGGVFGAGRWRRSFPRSTGEGFCTVAAEAEDNGQRSDGRVKRDLFRCQGQKDLPRSCSRQKGAHEGRRGEGRAGDGAGSAPGRDGFAEHHGQPRTPHHLALNISTRLWLGCPHGPLASTLPTEPRRSHRPCSTTPLVKGGRHKGKHDKKIGKSGEGLRINAQARLPGKMLKALAMVIEPSLGIFVFPALFDGQKS